MATTSVRSGGGIPGQVTAARVLVFIQAGLGLLAALGIALLGAKTGHGAVGGVLAAINLIFAITLLVAGVKMGACEAWTRIFVVAFEILVILNAIASLVVGGVAGIVSVALAIAVLVLLFSAPARSCFVGSR